MRQGPKSIEVQEVIDLFQLTPAPEQPNSYHVMIKGDNRLGRFEATGMCVMNLDTMSGPMRLIKRYTQLWDKKEHKRPVRKRAPSSSLSDAERQEAKRRKVDKTLEALVGSSSSTSNPRWAASGSKRSRIKTNRFSYATLGNATPTNNTKGNTKYVHSLVQYPYQSNNDLTLSFNPLKQLGFSIELRNNKNIILANIETDGTQVFHLAKEAHETHGLMELAVGFELIEINGERMPKPPAPNDGGIEYFRKFLTRIITQLKNQGSLCLPITFRRPVQYPCQSDNDLTLSFNP